MLARWAVQKLQDQSIHLFHQLLLHWSVELLRFFQCFIPDKFLKHIFPLPSLPDLVSPITHDAPVLIRQTGFHSLPDLRNSGLNLFGGGLNHSLCARFRFCFGGVLLHSKSLLSFSVFIRASSGFIGPCTRSIP